MDCKKLALFPTTHAALVIGLQFHLETTPESLQAIVSNCCDELILSQYVQTEKGILSVEKERYQEINQMMGNILSYLLKSLG